MIFSGLTPSIHTSLWRVLCNLMLLQSLHPSVRKCNIQTQIHRIQTALLLSPSVCVSGSERRPPRRCPAHQLSRHFSTSLCNANGCHLLKQTSCASSVNVGTQSSSSTAGLVLLQNATYLCTNFTHTHTHTRSKISGITILVGTVGPHNVRFTTHTHTS